MAIFTKFYQPMLKTKQAFLKQNNPLQGYNNHPSDLAIKTLRVNNAQTS
jgi:hypothetical protein